MPDRPLTLVCFAVKEEAASFKDLTRGRDDISILLTGMGEKNTRKSLITALGQRRPDRVVTSGFAGGLVPELTFGTIVFSAAPGTQLEAALISAGAKPVLFHCSKQVVTSAAQKRQVYLQTGALAIEMESGVIQEVCAAYGIPAVTVRVILDTAGEDLPFDFNKVMTADQKIDGGKLALALLKSPPKIGALLRLQRQSSAASKLLGTTLSQVLS